ncbi:MAG: hypothetical protein JW781_08925 [Deltaproteobacteria bacterium]|nr:hypothetical protein [Candidatus Anaeroferrophillacea bacterium]
MVRPVDLQQIIQATTQAGRFQHQQAHGAAVEQSKLVHQQRLKEEQLQQDVRETPGPEDAGLEHAPRREKELLKRRASRRLPFVAEVRKLTAWPDPDIDAEDDGASGRFVDLDA